MLKKAKINTMAIVGQIVVNIEILIIIDPN